MMQRGMGKKIVETAAKRLAPRGGTDQTRPDLYLADFQSISNDSARIMVGWAPGLEQPALAAVENWVTAKLNNQAANEQANGVTLNHATLKWHKASHVAEMVVGWILPTRRLEDSKSMAKVGPARFLEAGSNIVWEVRTGEDGEKHLVRKSDDDLGDLLKQRTKAAGRQVTTPSFASVKGSGTPDVAVGDQVRYLSEGIVRLGHVKASRGAEVVIEFGSDRKVEAVQTTNVTEVVTKDPATIQDYKSRVRDYYKAIFPPEYLNKWMKAGQE